jgi:hypothetical protein
MPPPKQKTRSDHRRRLAVVIRVATRARKDNCPNHPPAELAPPATVVVGVSRYCAPCARFLTSTEASG